MVVFRLLEDYLIVPKIIGKAVEVPATITVVAVLLGGAVLGIIGALIAIPVAAAVRILLMETVFHASTAPDSPASPRHLLLQRIVQRGE